MFIQRHVGNRQFDRRDGSGAVWLTRQAVQAGDPFDLAQARLFAPLEKWLRSG